MITIRIQYVALIEPVPGTVLSRVSFPARGHDLHVYRNGHRDKDLEGKTIALEFTDAADQPVLPAAQAPFPIGGRVLRISLATGGANLKSKSTKELLKNPILGGPDAQTVLYLPGGTFASKDPVSPSVYANEEWTFHLEGGKKHTQLLTDTVEWTIAPDPSWKCSVRVDDDIEAVLAHTETLQFTNTDNPSQPFPIKNNAAVLEEVEWLYELFDPKLPVVAAVTPMKPIAWLGGDLPLCPVGEP